LAEDQTDTEPRVRLIVDSSSPSLAAITLSRIEAGEPIPIGQANNLLVQLETLDNHGFDSTESAVLHYRVRAGEAEISRGSLDLPDTTPFGEQFFWSGNLDLTDGGATTLLPTYFVDVWVSGSDAAGNPFETHGNTMQTPFATWPLALLGPSIDLATADATWSNPSPSPGESVEFTVSVTNAGGSGDVTYVLQRQQTAGYWEDIASASMLASAGSEMLVTMSTTASGQVGDRLDHRLLLLVDGVEADRSPVAPLLITEDVARDGDALREDISEQRFSLVLYLITMLSLSAMTWMLVMYRRTMYGEDETPEDQTEVVVAAMEANAKAVPDLADLPPPPGLAPSGPAAPSASTTPPPPGLTMPPPPGLVVPTPPAEAPAAKPAPAPAPAAPADPRGAPPVPEDGLPNGWTEAQWAHYGWSWLDAQ